MNNINITINGKGIQVPDTYTIMEAADTIGIEIPRLCFLKEVNETAACRICVVEIDGIRSLKNSCTVKVSEGMVIKTNSSRVEKAIKYNLELLAANHKFECWVCPREHNCELLRLLRKYNVPNKIGEDSSFQRKSIITNITDALVLDSSKCILCGRCISTCQALSGVSILNYNNRGFKTYVGPALNHNMDDTGCIYCGKCIQACPVAAIREKDEIDLVLDLLEERDFYTVVQIAPSVRAALGEEFGYKIGTNVEGKMYKALDLLGFDDITDTNFAADLTIMEEGTEFINRFKKFINKEEVALPLFTSCSPGWIRYIETYYPAYLPNLSSCKSPQQIQGVLIKNYYADKLKIDKNKIKVVSVMPCIAKKYEAKRPEMEVDGIRDVDYVLTTRELARMIKRKDINFTDLEDFKPISPLAKYTGAGVIFGATGGVMEAALRTVKEILEETETAKVEIESLRGIEKGIKEATLKINDTSVNVAVVHGSVNIPEMFKRIQKEPKKYAFIEFMACSGGCVNGGGQPIVDPKVLERIDVRKERAKALYQIDSDSEIRKSHKNLEVAKIYEEFLKYPGSHEAHQLLHTKYSIKQKYSQV